MRRLVLASDADAPLAASAWLRTAAREETLDHEAEFRLDLCITELVSNIVTHGSAARIEINLDADQLALHLRSADDGFAFDPLTAQTAPRAETLEGAEPGGAGLPLIRAFCDSADYRWESDRNVLSFSVLRRRPDDTPDARRCTASLHRWHHRSRIPIWGALRRRAPPGCRGKALGKHIGGNAEHRVRSRDKLCARPRGA